MNFANNLRQAMLENNISQTQLAQKLNTTQATVSRWINKVNQPDFETLLLICNILERTPNELLGWED